MNACHQYGMNCTIHRVALSVSFEGSGFRIPSLLLSRLSKLINRLDCEVGHGPLNILLYVFTVQDYDDVSKLYLC